MKKKVQDNPLVRAILGYEDPDEKWTAEELIEKLQSRGYRIEKDDPASPRLKAVEIKSLATKRWKGGKTIRFGVVSDTQFGSRKQQLTFLHMAYEYFKEIGLDTVFHCGDLVDGDGHVYRGQQFDLFIHGFDRQLEYAVANYPRQDGITTHLIGGNHDWCVPGDVEHLSLGGWRKGPPDGSMPIATLNPGTQELEWQVPRAVVVNERYSGDLVHFDRRSIDHPVTPNHDVYARWRGRWAKRKPSTLGHFGAKGLVGAGWDGVDVESVVVGGERYAAQDLAKLVGWFVSEGCAGDRRITICQSREVHRREYDEIVGLVKRLGYAPSEGPKYIRFTAPGLAQWLNEECGLNSYDKRLPIELKQWSPRLLFALLRTAMMGDGTWDGEGSFPDYATYSSRSARLVDDLQEIAIKLGLRATRSDAVHYRLHFTRGPVVGMHYPRSEAYSGVVWCPVVDNGLWLSRRGGKALWTGNSFHASKGADILAALSKERPDIDYLGYGAAPFVMDGIKIHLLHVKAGLTYARSYKMQKIIEQFAPAQKPDFLFMGDRHSWAHLPMYRNVYGWQVGCFQAQTDHEARLGLYPEIGSLVVEVDYGTEGGDDREATKPGHEGRQSIVKIRQEILPVFVPRVDDY